MAYSPMDHSNTQNPPEIRHEIMNYEITFYVSTMSMIFALEQYIAIFMNVCLKKLSVWMIGYVETIRKIRLMICVPVIFITTIVTRDN